MCIYQMQWEVVGVNEQTFLKMLPEEILGLVPHHRHGQWLIIKRVANRRIRQKGGVPKDVVMVLL